MRAPLNRGPQVCYCRFESMINRKQEDFFFVFFVFVVERNCVHHVLRSTSDTRLTYLSLPNVCPQTQPRSKSGGGCEASRREARGGHSATRQWEKSAGLDARCQLICGIGAGGCFDVNNHNRSMGVSLVIFITELLYTRKGKQQDQKGYTHIKCVPVISQRDRYTNIKMV